MSSEMRRAILSAVVLCLLWHVLDHYFDKTVYDLLEENEGCQRMLGLLDFSCSELFNTGLAIPQEAGSYTRHTSRREFHGQKPESYYIRTIPRGVLWLFICYTLQHYWYLWLEKKLPARPRNRSSEVQEHYQHRIDEKIKEIEDGEDGDEEVIKRSMGQGRTQRASLNWRNTILKCIVDLTVGRIGFQVLYGLFWLLATFQNPSRIAEISNWVCFPFSHRYRGDRNSILPHAITISSTNRYVASVPFVLEYH